MSPLPRTGLLDLFLKHTSAALTLNESPDPDVRADMESIFNRLVREREPYYSHTHAGDDDMPAHAKSSLAEGVNWWLLFRDNFSFEEQ